MTSKEKDATDPTVATEVTEQTQEPNESVTKGVAAADPNEPVVESAAEGEGPSPPEIESGTGGIQAEPKDDVPEPRPAVALYSHTCGVVATGPKKRCPGCGQVQQMGEPLEWKRFDVLLA